MDGGSVKLLERRRSFKSHMGGRTFEGKPGGELTIESGKCWLGEEFSTERVRNGRLEAQERSGEDID